MAPTIAGTDMCDRLVVRDGLGAGVAKHVISSANFIPAGVLVTMAGCYAIEDVGSSTGQAIVGALRVPEVSLPAVHER